MLLTEICPVLHGLTWLALLASCGPTAPATEDSGPSEALAASPIWGRPELGRLADVALTPLETDPSLPRGTEIAGLATALLELGLADLDGVIPHVEGSAISPGLLSASQEGAERWTLRGRVREEAGALMLVVTVCSASGSCEDLRSARGTRSEPTPSAAEILDKVAARLVRPRRAETAGDQATVQSTDPYAVLLVGRSAAVWYGLLPTDGGKRGRDAVSHALLVGPDTAVGNWIAGRRALEAGDAEQAHARFVRAAFARPSSALLLADEASALDAAGEVDSAWATWVAVERARPGDPRFEIAVAAAALRAHLPEDAEARLAALAPEVRDAIDVVKLRVAAAEAAGRGDNPEYDALLARWEALIPGDPEPVRRRIQWRVHAEQYALALPFAEALVQRGADPQAGAILTALRAANGAWEAAAASAGDPALAARLRARGADAARRAALLASDPDSLAQAVRAAALLAIGQPANALNVAEAAVARAPLNPEALAARRDALAALGRVAEGVGAEAALRRVDPGLAQRGPRPHPNL